MKSASISLLAVFLFGSQICMSQAPPTTVKCEVFGSVVDQQDALVPGIEIFFTNGEVDRSTVTDASGKYYLALPPGDYEISLKMGVSSPIYKRARLRVSCPEKRELNIILLPWCTSLGCTWQGYFFSSFTDDWTLNKDLNLVIAYHSKTESRSEITYTDTTLTYNSYTVLAPKIIQDFKAKIIFVEGPGWIDDSGKRRNLVSLTIRFSRDGIIVEEK